MARMTDLVQATQTSMANLECPRFTFEFCFRQWPAARFVAVN
jgi:hypothetical protein